MFNCKTLKKLFLLVLLLKIGFKKKVSKIYVLPLFKKNLSFSKKVVFLSEVCLDLIKHKYLKTVRISNKVGLNIFIFSKKDLKKL